MPLFPQVLLKLAEEVLEEGRKKRLHIVTAESCTGGLLSGCLTEIPNASDVLDRGFVTYSTDSKMAQLSVERKTLTDFGAVSPATALEMAEGALRASHADVAVAITGIAGPNNGTTEKPVGLVYIALTSNKNPDDPTVVKNNFTGDRTAVRLAAVEKALTMLKDEIAKI